MNLGIMQPYFFPYAGYFSLIKATDKWIVFDTPQFAQYSWMSRNRIIKPNSNDWMYFRVPVKKHHLSIPIHDVLIQNKLDWKNKIVSQLGHYKKYAPFYKETVDFLNYVLKDDFNTLLELNVHIIQSVCTYIGIKFDFDILSKLNLELEPAHHPDDWALVVTKALGYSQYINAERGQAFFNRQNFKDANIDLKFLVYQNPEYDQKIEKFQEAMSIVDVLMFNSISDTRLLLDDYILVK